MRTLAASLWLLAASLPAVAAVIPKLGPSAAGWSLSEAVRAVAIRNPDLELPPGVAFSAVAALPADSPVWTKAAQHIAESADPGATPEKMVQSALYEIGDAAGRRLFQVLDPTYDGAPLADELDDLSRLSVLLPSGSRSALEDALKTHGARTAKTVAAAGRLSQALAAGSVDPGLVVAQYGVQHGKNIFRDVVAFERSISPQGSTLYERPNPYYRSSRVAVPKADKLVALVSAPLPLRAMVDDLRRAHGSVVWADVGGGIGVVQRQWSLQGLGPDVRRILVDLFDWEKLSQERFLLGIVKHGRELFAAEHRPELRLADAASVRFSPATRPNLITSIESIQYWPDKLRGLVNLYNQLQDDGLLAISTKHAWPAWIRTRDALISHADPLFDDAIGALVEADVEIAAFVSEPKGGVEESHTIVIRKRAGTRLVQRVRLHEAWVDPHGYSVSYYEKRDGGRAPIRIVSATSP